MTGPTTTDDRRASDGECEVCGSPAVARFNIRRQFGAGAALACELCIAISAVGAQEQARPDARTLAAIAYVGNEILAAVRHQR